MQQELCRCSINLDPVFTVDLPHLGFLFKQKSNKTSLQMMYFNAWLASPFHVHSIFCRIFNGCAWKTKKLVYLYWKRKQICTFRREKKVFSICVYLQFGRGVTGIRRSSPSAVGLALCDASFVLFLPHKDLKWLMLIYTWHIYEFIHIYFCCFFAIN